MLTSVAFCPDGTHYAAAGWDSIRIWEAHSGRFVRSFGFRRGFEPSSVALGPRCQVLAAGGLDGAVGLWDVATGLPLQIVEAHRKAVSSLAIGPRGKLLATGSGDKLVKIWDLRSGRLLRVLRGHKRRVQSVVFGPKGKLLASGGFDRSVRVWSATSGRQLRVLGGQPSQVSAVAIDPHGRLLVSGGQDKKVRIWDLQTGALLRELAGHAAEVTSLSIDSRGELLASGSFDGTVRLWDLKSGGLRQTLGRLDFRAQVTAAAIAPKGRRVVTAVDYEVKVWETRTGRLSRRHGNQPQLVRSVATVSGGRLLLSGGDGALQLWDLQQGRLLRTVERELDEEMMVVLSDRMLEQVATLTYDGEVAIRAFGTARRKRILAADGRALAFGPRGRWVAVGGGHGEVRLIDRREGKTIRSNRGSASTVILAFDPRGRFLVSAGIALKLWSLPSMQLLSSVKGVARPYSAVAFSSKGDQLVTAGQDRQLKQWRIEVDRRSGATKLGLVRMLVNAHQGEAEEVDSIAFSPTGRWIATSTGPGEATNLWNAGTGEWRHTFAGGCAAFIKAGTLGLRLATCVKAGVTLWNLGSYKPELSLMAEATGQWAVIAHGEGRSHVDSSSNGRRLVEWRAGFRQYPWHLAWSRYHVPGLLRRVVKGDTAFRLKHLGRLIERMVSRVREQPGLKP